jgi:uncharacterized protein YraI
MRVLGLLVISLAACTANADGADVDESSSHASRVDAVVPTLSFGADWSVKASGPITSGGKAIIHYEIARQPACRMRYRGFDAWGISAYYAVDGGFARSVPVTQLSGQDNVVVDATIDVPPGKDLAVWFHASDEGGCSTWDSNYGSNYHFALVQDASVLHFKSDGSIAQEGTLQAGKDVLLDYDLSRLPTCRATYNGYQTWDVVAHVRFDGGPVRDIPVTATSGMYGRVAVPARVTIPEGAHQLETWFDNTDRTGCHAWDSAYGANYRFAL